MTVFELEDALVEFCAQNTAELRYRSNEQSVLTAAPEVWAGYIPRDEVGAIMPGDITVYPAIIVNAQSGVQNAKSDEMEIVTVNIMIGCFDDTLDQQGYRDCCNLVQRLKDRFREIDIIAEHFAVEFPISWKINQRYGGAGTNSFPYFFAEMQINFKLPVMQTQFDITPVDGDVTPGRYNEYPIPTEAAA